MLVDRSSVEKIIEQELSAILLQCLKLSEKEGKLETKEAFQIILRVIDARRDERERAMK